MGVAAEGDNIVEAFPRELVENLGSVSRDVDPQFGQDLDGQGIDPRGLRAGGERLEAVAQVVVDEPLRHLGAAGVVGAEEEDALFHGSPIAQN